MAYTPGPWRITKGSYWLRIVGPQKQAVVSFGNQRRWLPQREVEANARLISAAPDLLAAAILARDNAWGYGTQGEMKINRTAYNALCAAIAKTEETP